MQYLSLPTDHEMIHERFSRRVCNVWGYPRCNIIYSFSLFYGLFSGLGLLLRMFCFLCFTSAARNKLYSQEMSPFLKVQYGNIMLAHVLLAVIVLV